MKQQPDKFKNMQSLLALNFEILHHSKRTDFCNWLQMLPEALLKISDSKFREFYSKLPYFFGYKTPFPYKTISKI